MSTQANELSAKLVLELVSSAHHGALTGSTINIVAKLKSAAIDVDALEAVES